MFTSTIPLNTRISRLTTSLEKIRRKTVTVIATMTTRSIVTVTVTGIVTGTASVTVIETVTMIELERKTICPRFILSTLTLRLTTTC